MFGFREVCLYDDGLLAKGMEGIAGKSEMSSFERSFLCGLIKEKHPQKILEVGVAAGATTALIIKQLEYEHFYDTKFFSVDYSKSYYLDQSKSTGYLATEMKKDFNGWRLFLGKTVAGFIDEICVGGKIDFLILDTMHVLPGEVLDFIACLPYLKNGAIVVLHDVGLNLRNPGCESASATRALFSAVSAEKIYMADTEKFGSTPNIAAFIVTEATREKAFDLFSVLHLSWDYMPSEHDYLEYRSIIEKEYNAEYGSVLDDIYKTQSSIVIENAIDSHYRIEKKLLLNKIQSAGCYIYGAGTWGKIYYDYCRKHNVDVRGVLVSDGEPITEKQQEIFDGHIKYLSEIREVVETPCIIAVGEKYISEIKRLLKKQKKLIVV